MPVRLQSGEYPLQPAAVSPIVSGSDVQRVTIVDINMPFGSMVGFMVKWAIAAIPALLILSVIGGVLVALLAAFASLSTSPSLRP